MANKKKNIIEEALLDAQRIQEAVKANTKEILRSTMKEEIEDIVKESVLEEADYYEEDVDSEEDYSADDMTPDTEGGDEMEADDDAEMEADDAEMEMDYEGEEEGSEEMDYDMGDMDMTTASDDEVIAVYKKLNGDDEIEVVGDKIHLTVSEPGEYVIDTNSVEDVEEGMYEYESVEEGDCSEEAEVEEMYEGLTYEITINEEEVNEMEDIEGQTAPVGKIKNNNFAGDNLEGGFTEEDPNGGMDAHCDHVMETEEVVETEEVTEAMEETMEEANCDEDTIEEKISSGVGMSVGKHRNQSGPGSIGSPEGPGAKVNESEGKVVSIIAESKEMKLRYSKLLKETKGLMAEKAEFQKTLKQLRNQLIETAVFNSNLAAVTRLFTEHTTTKEEKQQILKRFDNGVNSIEESKKLYKTIKGELNSKKPLKESVESKITITANSGSKKPQLDESTVYVDKEVKRIKDLMNRVSK